MISPIINNAITAVGDATLYITDADESLIPGNRKQHHRRDNITCKCHRKNFPFLNLKKQKTSLFSLTQPIGPQFY